MGRMLFTEACSRGYLDARLKLFLSDGAESVSAMRKEHFPDAQASLDWYHVVEHLDDCGKAAYGSGREESKEWFEVNKERLWYGDVGTVLEDIAEESHKAGAPPKKAPDTDPRVILRRNVGYFTRNQSEMDYPTYRANGWPIGSGVAEGSVKQHNLRVKGSEKFWELPRVEEMLALCALYFSEDGRWDQYWRARSRPPPDAIAFRALTSARVLLDVK